MIPGEVDTQSEVLNLASDSRVSGNAGGVAGVLAGAISYTRLDNRYRLVCINSSGLLINRDKEMTYIAKSRGTIRSDGCFLEVQAQSRLQQTDECKCQ